jgi:DNA gyrase subunit A
MATGEKEHIIPINIADEMRGAYIDYSMSVIVSRALPDVRDGLKPVHRRVLYGMYELGLNANKPFKKAARIVGEVLGKYHPHGDGSVYDAMVRMAQAWSLRYPLVEGQGNFGSIDGDEPAAMRYTEARLARTAESLLADIGKGTIDFRPNFDDSLEEPVVLPAKLPNLLINGTSGIAVGMATNMPPHNLTEVINGIIAYIDDRDITIDRLVQYIVAPDFPTGGVIYGYQGVKDAYRTGKGRVVMRAKATIEPTSSGRDQIIVTEIPYMVNKSVLIAKTAQLVNEKKLEGIADIRDESDKDGLRVVYELKKDAIANVVLNNLYKQTALQTSFGVNNVALVAGKPQLLNLKDLIQYFVAHRHEVLVRKTKYELEQAEHKQHILAGYMIALDNLDNIITLIRSAKDPEVAKSALIRDYSLSVVQAKAILDMRLQRLTGLEREKIVQEHQEIQQRVAQLNTILADEALRMRLIKEELEAMQARYGDVRKTTIEYDANELTIADIVPNEEMVITISNEGYVKRTPLVAYKTQGRGGVGARGASTKQDDFTAHLFVASTHSYLLIFTELGRVYWKQVYTIPEGSKTARGRAIQNLINIASGDQVKSVLTVKSLEDVAYVDRCYVIMCTEKGMIKKTSLAAYAKPRNAGVYAIRINGGDRLLEVKLTEGDSHIIMALKSGRAIRFHERDVRPMGRVAAGVRGITLSNEDDRVVGLVSTHHTKDHLLVVASKGFGKRSAVSNYRITKRGGKGVKTLQITEKTGTLVAIKSVRDADELMIVNKSGITIRITMRSLRVLGRATQGVRLIRLAKGDQISSIAKIESVVLND